MVSFSNGTAEAIDTDASGASVNSKFGTGATFHQHLQLIWLLQNPLTANIQGSPLAMELLGCSQGTGGPIGI